MFGRRHAVAVITSFFENVSLHTYEHRKLRVGEKETNVLLHFEPSPPTEMVIAALWDHWSQEGRSEIYSWAAVTDEPTDEIKAAGHDRSLVPLQASNIEAWLRPDGHDKAELSRLLDHRQQLHFAHAIAA